jgi:hypothetical protein
MTARWKVGDWGTGEEQQDFSAEVKKKYVLFLEQRLTGGSDGGRNTGRLAEALSWRASRSVSRTK